MTPLIAGLVSQRTFEFGHFAHGAERQVLGRLVQQVDQYGDPRFYQLASYAIDPSSIEAELNWRPQTSFEEGLAETIDWYLANRGWIDRIRSVGW